MRNRLFCLLLVVCTLLFGAALAEESAPEGLLTFISFDTGYPVQEITALEAPLLPELVAYTNPTYYYGQDSDFVGYFEVENYGELRQTYGGTMSLRIERTFGTALWLSFESWDDGESGYRSFELSPTALTGENGTVGFRITCTIGGYSSSCDVAIEVKTPANGLPEGIERYNPQDVITTTVGTQLVLYYPDFLPIGWTLPGEELMTWFDIMYEDPVTGEFDYNTDKMQYFNDPENKRLVVVPAVVGYYSVYMSRDYEMFHAWDDVSIKVCAPDGSFPVAPDHTVAGFHSEGEQLRLGIGISNHAWVTFFDGHYDDCSHYELKPVRTQGSNVSVLDMWIEDEGWAKSAAFEFYAETEGESEFRMELYEDGVLLDTMTMIVIAKDISGYPSSIEMPEEITLSGKVGEPICLDLTPYLRPVGSHLPEITNYAHSFSSEIAGTSMEGNTMVIMPWFSGTFTTSSIYISVGNILGIDDYATPVRITMIVADENGVVADRTTRPMMVYAPVGVCGSDGCSMTVSTGVVTWMYSAAPVITVSLLDESGRTVVSENVAYERGLMMLSFDHLAEGVYYPQITAEVAGVETVTRTGDAVLVSKNPGGLRVGEVIYNMSDDGKSCFIKKPVITGGSGNYTIAYNIYDSQGNPINYFYSNDEWVAATCPKNEIYNVFVVVNDGVNMPVTVMTGWFEVTGYAEMSVSKPEWSLSPDGKSCFIFKPVIEGGTAPYTIAYNIYDSNSNPINYFYSNDAAVAATCPYDGTFNVFVVVTDAQGVQKIVDTGWFIVTGYSGVTPQTHNEPVWEEEEAFEDIFEIPEEVIEEIPAIEWLEEIPVMPEIV